MKHLPCSLATLGLSGIGDSESLYQERHEAAHTCSFAARCGSSVALHRVTVKYLRDRAQ